jgi:tetratricopeptide (TPR) repeat protein
VLAVCGFLLLAVFLVFGQTIGYRFVNYDDDQYVFENARITRGVTLQGIAWAFTHSQVGHWHPLTSISHMLDCQFYGLWPGGHHLTNVLLHAATAIVLFLVLWQMTGGLWSSALVAAVFAVHPLRAESVAWVSERKDVLSGLFFVLTLAAYTFYVRRPFSWGRYLAVVSLFAVGLMAKPMLVTLPCVLLLLDYWPLGRMSRDGAFHVPRRLIVEKLPLVVMTVACSLAALLTQRKVMVSMESMPWRWRLSNALVSYVVYLKQFFCPTGLAILYPHPKDTIPAWSVIASAGVLAAVSAAALLWRRRYPFLLVGWLWYLGMLVPVIGLVQLGMQARADRYTYLSQIGIAIALVWGAVQVAGSSPYRRWGVAAVSVLVVAGLMGGAWQQTRYWRDSETLWIHTLACTSQNSVAHHNLAAILAGRGQIEEAIAHYRRVLEIKPGDVKALYNLGNLLAGRGQIEEAIAHYREALAVRPDHARANCNLGVLLAGRGQGDEAIAHFRTALETRPDYAEAHDNLGAVLAGRGQAEEAIAQYRKALEIKPDFVEALGNLGNVLAARGRVEEAITQYRKALNLATQQNNQVLADSMQAKIRLYEAGKPFHKPPASPAETSIRP